MKMNETERKNTRNILRGEPSCDGWLFGPVAADGTLLALDTEPGAADAAGGTKMDEEEAAWVAPAELATGGRAWHATKSRTCCKISDRATRVQI